jgi:hypothetical protein
MKRMLLGLGFLGLSAALGGEARAQYPGGSVVYETVAPGTRTVTYGERYVVKQRPFKTVIRERPTRYVTVTPPVVRETRLIRTAPVIQQQLVQPPPVVETRLIQPPPVYQRRVVQPDPVIQTRYLSPYPY